MAGKQRNMRLSPDDDARFVVVARSFGLSVPNTIRLLMKREWDRVVARKERRVRS